MHSLQSKLRLDIQHIKYLYQIKNTYVANYSTNYYASKFLYYILDKHIPLITLDEDVLEEIRHLYQASKASSRMMNLGQYLFCFYANIQLHLI